MSKASKGDASRTRKLETALRENLKRRKQQKRARGAKGEPSGGGLEHEEAAKAPDSGPHPAK